MAAESEQPQLDENGRPVKEFGHPFFQAKMTHSYAQVSPRFVILCLFFVGCTFIPLGAAIIVAGDQIFEQSTEYQHIHKCSYASNHGAETYTVGNSSVSMGCTTNIAFELKADVVKPVYIYYRLKGFHQNYRLYAKSFDEAQLYSGSSAVTDDCKPKKSVKLVIGGEEKELPYAPCGQVPWSMFNDTISLYKAPTEIAAKSVGTNSSIPTGFTAMCLGGAFDASTNEQTATNNCVKKGIAFSQDVKKRFTADIAADSQWTGKGYSGVASNEYFRQGYYDGEPGHRLPMITDEDFMVWARIAPLADFRKLYRKITVDLPAGWYVWQINERFDTTSIDAEKHVILATRLWIGGKNDVLGALYVTMGAVSLLLAFGSVGMYLNRE